MTVESRGHEGPPKRETHLEGGCGWTDELIGRGYGPPPKISSLMAMPASSASSTSVVIMRTAVCIAVRRTSRCSPPGTQIAGVERALVAVEAHIGQSARFAPSSAARVRIASDSWRVWRRQTQRS